MILVIWTLFMLLMEIVLAAKSTVESASNSSAYSGIYDNFYGDGSFCNSSIFWNSFLSVTVDKLYRQATSQSLCLLDEFGKGTLTEG